MKWAYYNEIDPFAAAWLRELIKAGLIVDGEVDERSIVDVRPDDLRGFRQCHFFAGIGGWSLALRRAGWPDNREVWTGSCPCQPFSAAGAGGGFADERHLWPAWHWLINQHRPGVIFGEQVESPAARLWVDLVSTDMEGTGYAFGASDLPAASVGAPGIRQRLFWVADVASWRCEPGSGPSASGLSADSKFPSDSDCATLRMADESSGGLGIDGRTPRQPGHADERREAGRLVDGRRARGRRHAGTIPSAQAEGQSERIKVGSEPDESQFTSDLEWMVNVDGLRFARLSRQGQARVAESGAARGLWADADWLYCRDEKFRPVEPGTFPLAYGVPARVGRLRGYGNAILPQVAQVFIEAYLDCCGDA